MGNITSVSDGTYTNSYVYDSLNQLVRENNQKFGKTYTYAYTNGNITESKEYAYTTGELGTPLSVYNWSYGDGTWSDLLTAWNEGAASTANASSASAFSLQNTAESDETSQSFFKRALQRDSANGNVSRAARTTETTPSFSYDEIGNPTEIFDLQFSWDGRQLTSLIALDDPYVSRVDFGYNMDGQRISRTFTAPDGTVKTTEYFYNGEILAGEKTGDRTVVYMYDNDGNIFGFETDGRIYYYVKNAQNDVTAITDSNGTVVVRYYYDAWGDPNYTHYACNGQTLDDVQDNPILYRSYYYDIDVGFYYLNSRYYVPMFCRFLNADDHDVSLVSLESSNYDKNLFAYCDNNPISRVDTGGYVWETIFDVVSLGASIVEVAINPTDPWAWAGLIGDTVDLIPFVTGVGEVTRAVKTIDKVADTVQIAKAVDFTEDAADIVKTLDRSRGFTKSTASAGRKIHQGYKATNSFPKAGKEFREIRGIRPDYIDFNTRTIYELKPMNPRGVRSGIRQLQRYNRALGGGFNLRLELY